MSRSIQGLMAHLEQTGALCFDHGDSASDRQKRRALELEVQDDPDYEVVIDTAYQFLVRRKK